MYLSNYFNSVHVSQWPATDEMMVPVNDIQTHCITSLYCFAQCCSTFNCQLIEGQVVGAQF